VPTYQYACTACEERLEAVQSFTDAPLSECPACGGALRKVFSPVGVVFKGSGFYKTDSRGGAQDGGGKADKADKGDKADKAEAPAASGKAEAGSGTSAGSSSSSTSSAPAKPAPAATSTAPAGKSA